MSRPLRVFLCHASQDKPAVWKLHRYLKQHGVQPWLDQEDLLPGQNWEVEIPNALFSSDVILVCLSKNSVDKEGYVQKEITFALDKAQEKPEGTIFIIPVKLEECDIPKRLSRYQWVDLSRTDGRKRLLMGLNKRATDLGVAISSVLLEDARQRKTSPKPSAAENKDNETSMSARILATAKTIHEQEEREDREKAELEAMNGKAQKSAESAVPNADEQEKKQKFDRVAVEAQYLKETLESIDGVQTTAVRPVSVGPVEKKVPLAGEYKPAAQPTPSLIAGSQLRKLKFPVWVIGLLAFGLLSLSVWGVYQLTTVQAIPTSSPLLTSMPALTIPSSIESLTGMPTVTFTETLVKTPTAIFTETPTEPSLGIGSTMIGKDDMVLVYIPAGNFLMGVNDDSFAQSSERPQHFVYLNAFWFDQTEVTNAMYAKCVLDGKCLKPKNIRSKTHDNYYDNVEFSQFPVINIDWYMAKTYCEWAGRSLPTEAQWEKAARGEDGRSFPWGEHVNCTYANYLSDGLSGCVGDVAAVGSYPKGKSPYGIYDMAGNASEWVQDWFSYDYYQTLSALKNPLGPDSGTYRVLRGGSWYDFDYQIRSDRRTKYDPSLTDWRIGFRCSFSLP